MIDLGFLTEAEQEAILQVLQRDAELKKAEEERIRHLQDVVSDENELKYKSGQWFYEAKSKRHRDKIHGADLVRASIRKRKKPATIAELSEMSKSKSKRRSVNSVNKDLFIPPELHGVMEAPDEADEDLTIDKAETNQSSKRVSFSPPDKDKDILKNGLSSPAKQRKNPFNSEGLEEVTDLGGDTTDSRPEDVQVNGQPEKKPDIMSSVIKYGVKLPYPELTGGRRISQKAADDSPPKPEPQYPVPKPVPKPRTFYTNGQVPQQTDSPLKREDSFNGTNRRGILKRRSSSSSTDSESMRIPHSIESNKIVLPVSPIPEASQNYLFDEQPATSEGSPERQKQVRFSEKVQQKPPSPKPEPYSVRETDEFGILEPGLYSDSESVPVQFPHSAVDYNDSAEIIGQNGLREKPSISSSDAEEHLVDPDDEISDHKVQTILEERPPERSVDYNDTEALYATVDKTPKSASSDQAQVFAMEDALREPRFLGQGGKTSNKYQNEKPLVFGQSYGGGGKINFEPRYPTRNPKESFNFTREQVLAPERVTHVESPYYDLENKTMTMPQYDDDSTVSVATWRRPAILENRESLREPPTDDTEQNQKPSTFTVEKVPRVDFKEQDRLSNTNPENELNSKYFPGEYKREAKYESLLLRNTHNANYRPAGPTLKSANFKVMSLKERMNELPRQQMSDPAQFQSLKHFWNVEEKNSQRADVGTSPNKLPTDILSRNKPTRADLKQRNSKEMPTDDLILPNTFDSLSEEEQNSQKVASWLAQTPTVYGVDQVDHSEETFDPSEVTENIQISSANKRNKPEAFASALQRPQIEALESRRITEPEKLRTQEISAVSLNSMDNSSPAANIKTADRSFYEQVLKRSNKPSSGKETKSIVLDIPTMHTVQSEHNGGEAVEETVSKTVAPAKEKSAFNIGFEKLQAEYAKPHEEHQTDELRLPNENLSNEEANEPEEVIKKSAAPKSRDQLDFILSLNKLEMEASKPPPLPNEIQDDLPDKEIALNTVSPVESSYKIGIEHISSAKDNGQFDSPIEDSITFQAPIYYPPDNDHTAEVANEDEETVEKTTVPNVESDLHSALKKLQAEYAKSHEEYQTDESNLPIENPSEEDAHESEEVIKKSVAPKSRDQVDFILSLNKLEMEASKPPLRPIENQDSQPDEEITLNTVSPVKSSYNIGFEHFSTNEANDHRTFPIEQPLSYQAPVYYPPSNDHSAEVTNEVEETVGKTTVPNVESDLSSALKKLELEAQSINENVEQDHEESNTYPTLQVNKNMAQSIYINSSKDLSPTEKTQPDLQLPYSSKDGRSVAEVEEPPMEDKQIFQIELPKSTVDTQENLPVAEEEAIERTVVKTQENNDFQNQLMRLQDEATTISEEPEDLSVSDTVTVSQFPNRKIISKTVFPSIESIPRYTYDTHDSEKTNEVTVNESSPWNKSEDPTEQMSPVYSRLEKLAKHPRSADKSGSYQGSARNVHYKKPENSTGVSNSEPGKPAPAISSSDSASSRHDKYTAEVMKAQDESISKVLDWFSRSSDTGDEQSPSVGLTEEAKNSQQQILTHVGTSEDEPGAGVENIVSGCLTPDETESFSESELPKMVVNPHSKLIDNIDNISTDQMNILNAAFTTPITPTEEGSIPLKQVHSHSKAEELLEFGKSGGGCGKINNQAGNDDFVGNDLQMDKKLYVFENRNEGIKTELEAGTLKSPSLVQVGTGEPPVYSDQMNIPNAEFTTPITPTEEGFIPLKQVHSHSKAEELLEFVNSGGGFGKINNQVGNDDFVGKDLQMDKKPDVFENRNESIKTELEAGTLKSPSFVQVGTGEPPVYSDEEKEIEVTSTGPTLLEPSDPLQNPKKQELGKLNIPQNRVSDIKQFWEREKPSQSVTKKLVLKRTFSPSEPAITQKSSSFDSDDQNGSSIVTFRKVMLEEDDDDQLSPIDQLKSFWENEKPKEVAKGPPGVPSMKNRSLDIEQVTSVAEPIPDFRKRHTFNFYSKNQPITGQESNVPQRSVSLGENTNEGRNNQQKSFNFQSLRSFWSVDNAKGINPRLQALSGTSNRQFNSNPDIRSRDPLIAKMKTKIASKSLEDIRDHTPDSSHFESYDPKHDVKDKSSSSFNVDELNTTDPTASVQESEKFPAPKQQFDSEVNLNALNKEVSAERSHSVECEFGGDSSVLPSNTSNFTVEVKQDKIVPKQAKVILNNVEISQNPDYSSEDGREEFNKQPNGVTSLPQQNYVENLKTLEPSLEEKSILAYSSSAEEVPEAIENISSDTNLNKLYDKYSRPDEPNGTEITQCNQISDESKVHELNPSNSADPTVQQDSEPKVGLETYGAVSDEIPSKIEQEMSPEQLTEVSEVVLRSFAPRRADVKLNLQKLRDELTGNHSSLPREQTSVSSLKPMLLSKSIENNQHEIQDEENGEHIYSNVANDGVPKKIFIKQGGFDNSLTKSPVDPNVFVSPPSSAERDYSESVYAIGKDTLFDSHEEPMNESVGETVVPPKNGFSDFNKGLQNIYSESLDAPIIPNTNLPNDESVKIQEPGQGVDEVLAVSSSENGSKVQRSSSTDKKYTSYQSLILSISSKKTDDGNVDPSTLHTKSSPIIQRFDDLPPLSLDTLGTGLKESSESANLISEEPTSKLNVSFARETKVTEGNIALPSVQSKKEIVERIPSPIVLSRTPFFHFDERLKKLYEESSDLKSTLMDTMDMENVTQKIEHEQKADVYLYSSEPKTTILTSFKSTLDSPETMPADREALIDKSAASDSQAPDILVQEVEETIVKSYAPKRIQSYAKSLEKLQKEAVGDEEGRLTGNMPPNPIPTSELQPKLNENVLLENRVSAAPPEEREVSVQEKMDPAAFEESHDSAAETKLAFISLQQSTPVKEKSSSLRRSTLELYLEAPYRREISKSIDFNLSGYVTSGVDKERCMEDPILSALKRSTAKTLNSKAVQEVSPTSTNKVNLETPNQDALAPTTNSFPDNAEKYKRMSQSVPAFPQDDTDGRETDSASESSFQIGRHKKSPSSLTNLSGSSGMASMSSVSGSVMSMYSGDFGNVDVKGSMEFSLEYVDQLKEFLIYIYQCKELSAADTKKQRSDPYVKAYLLPEKSKMGKRKTAVKKKTLSPVYNEILRYKIPYESLINQTLNLSVWHHDVLGRNSFLGEVNVNLETWDWKNKEKSWYALEPRTPAAGVGLEHRGEVKLSLKYNPESPAGTGPKAVTTGEVHIWIKECLQLPMLREKKINSFVKCTILPDTSRKSRQKTRTVDKTPNPIFNHTMVYDGFKEEDLREACVELTVWDHTRLSNHFIGGLRLGLGTGKSYGTPVDWMDSSHEETTMWQRMIASPNTWVEGLLPLRMFKMAKIDK